MHKTVNNRMLYLLSFTSATPDAVLGMVRIAVAGQQDASACTATENRMNRDDMN
jgi:hypothetical protein